MVEHIRNLHKPVHANIDGHDYVLLTVGHVTRALGRSTWTVKYWERLRLFPKAPFRLHPDVPQCCKRLYPADFVTRLEAIVEKGYLGNRLDYEDWPRFR